MKNESEIKYKKSPNIIFQMLFSSLVAFVLVTSGLVVSYYLGNQTVDNSSPIETFSDSLVVLGEETENSDQDKASFSSENFQIKQISLGDGVIVSEDVPQENFLSITDIKGEAYISEQNKKNFKILVTWKTNQPSRFEIEYYPILNKKDKQTLENSTYNMNHATVINNLNSGESYVYKIHCVDRWGKEASSEPHSILSSSEPVLITDLINKAFKDIFGWAMNKD